MAKQKALSTQLKEAQAKIAELEKNLNSANSTKDSYYKTNQELRDEIEQVHQVLDSVPNSIARKSEDDESWKRVDRSIVTRLAAWLAIR